MAEYTAYQHGIIRRYYSNRDRIAEQRLGELVSEIFLAKGKQLDRLWKDAATALGKIQLPQSRIDQILSRRDPQLLADIVKELNRKA